MGTGTGPSKFYEALGLSASNQQKFSNIKKGLCRLAYAHLDISYQYKKQPDCCLALFRLNVSLQILFI
jgi:hypothetical protein